MAMHSYKKSKVRLKTLMSDPYKVRGAFKDVLCFWIKQPISQIKLGVLSKTLRSLTKAINYLYKVRGVVGDNMYI